MSEQARRPRALVRARWAWCATRMRSAPEAARGGPPVRPGPRCPAAARAPARLHARAPLEPDELPMGEEWYRAQGIEVTDTDRGGRVTYHGPGSAGRLSGHEPAALSRRRARVHPPHGAAIIASLADVGIEAGPIEGLTGVWTPEPRKIASIGVHVSRGVTTHGFAINVNNDLQPFEWIVPCGIDHCQMTSVARELARAVRHGRLHGHRRARVRRRVRAAAGRQDAARSLDRRRGGRAHDRAPSRDALARAARGRGAATDADVLPFRERKPPWLKVKAPGGPATGGSRR